MPVLEITHRTTYRYAKPVTLGQHEAMLRPHDSHDLRILDARLTVSPPATVSWRHDPFSNSITVFDFKKPASQLLIESRLRLEHYGKASLDTPVSEFARTYPFSYPSDIVPDLGRTIERHYPDPEHAIDLWAKSFIPTGGGPVGTEKLLLDMTRAVRAGFSYSIRDEYGTQSPTATLATKSGSCRDFALLMMEAVRSLGFAARFVTGYLYDPAIDRPGGQAMVGAGATHAWVQVYLPGAGWVEYDPTNGLIGGPNLIRVGVTRDPAQAVIVTGSFTGGPDDFLGMEVAVQVHAAG